MPEISSVFVIAFVVLFWHATTWEGMINHWIHKVAYNWPEWIKKPLYDCPICCAPWWGSLILAVTGWPGWVTAILTVFAAGGINTVLIYLISADKEITKELKDDE